MRKREKTYMMALYIIYYTTCEEGHDQSAQASRILADRDSQQAQHKHLEPWKAIVWVSEKSNITEKERREKISFDIKTLIMKNWHGVYRRPAKKNKKQEITKWNSSTQTAEYARNCGYKKKRCATMSIHIAASMSDRRRTAGRYEFGPDRKFISKLKWALFLRLPIYL